MARSQQPQIVVVYSDPASPPLDAATLQELVGTGHGSGQKSGTEVPKTRVSEFVPAPKSAVSRKLRGGDPVVPFTSPRVCRPQDIHRDFPARWQLYIRSNFHDLNHVQQVFGVSERTARKWWNGDTGANGGHVAVAVAEHPIAAPRMLFPEV